MISQDNLGKQLQPKKSTLRTDIFQYQNAYDV
jgi:hypothetical protein